MSKEARSIFLVVLTLVFYAVSIALQSGGTLVFPFPLNPFFFFAVAAYFIYLHRKQKAISIIIGASALFGVLSSKVLWEILLSVESMESFLNFPWIYWFQLLYGVALLTWAAFTLIKQNDTLAKIITLLGMVMFSIGYVSGQDGALLVGLGLITFSALYEAVYHPFQMLWLLLFILESTKWLNFFVA